MNSSHIPNSGVQSQESVVPVLDVARGVAMMGSEDSLRMILGTVITSLADNLPEIQTALQSGDVVAANRLLHAIKGYVPIFATDALSDQVTEVEKASKTEPVEVVAPMYSALEPQLQGLLAEIRNFLV